MERQKSAAKERCIDTKETCKKRPLFLGTDQYKETNICGKRPVKRDLCLWRDICKKRCTTLGHVTHMEHPQKRPVHRHESTEKSPVKNSFYLWKETC